MTERDSFILRWARLKRTSETGHKTDPSKDKPTGSAHADVAGAEVMVAQPRIDVAADGPLDLASLPLIEAITAQDKASKNNRIAAANGSPRNHRLHCSASSRWDQMQKSRSHISSEPRVDEIDRARAQGYALLATLFSRSPDI